MITVVSGLPRSGTSLMMQMLAAGGLPVLADDLRQPDANNPKGYLEWDPIKRLRDHPEKIAAAEGRVVKVVSPLIKSLSDRYRYQVIFMEREVSEILESQAEMMRRFGEDYSPGSDTSLQLAYEKHLRDVLGWIEKQDNFRLLRVSHAQLIRDPLSNSKRVSEFVGRDLDVDAMVRQVDPSLYRQRKSKADAVGK